MEYNLNGYWNQGDGNKGGDRKEEGKKDRKHFRNGMFTGILLCLFILCCVYTVKQLCDLHRMRMDKDRKSVV